MRNVVWFDANGKILMSGGCAPGAEETVQFPFHGWAEGTIHGSLDKCWIDIETGEVHQIPDQPSPYHVWDSVVRAWIVPQARIDKARADKTAEITKRRDQLLAAPIEFEGVLFDADAFSLSNMTGAISRIERGDGLTAGWTGWRVADNSMVWADATAEQVLAKLKSIALLIENRTQAILNASWQHKDAIGALTTLSEVLAYDTSLLWPS